MKGPLDRHPEKNPRLPAADADSFPASAASFPGPSLEVLLSGPRSATCLHHHALGRAWLETASASAPLPESVPARLSTPFPAPLAASASIALPGAGLYPVPLAYAAFELGQALECLAFEMLEFFRDGRLQDRDREQLRGSHSMTGYLLQLKSVKGILARKLRFHQKVMEVTELPYARAVFDVGRVGPLREACASLSRPLGVRGGRAFGSGPDGSEGHARETEGRAEEAAGSSRENAWLDPAFMARARSGLFEVEGFLAGILRDRGEGWVSWVRSDLKLLQDRYLHGKLKDKELEEALSNLGPALKRGRI